MMKKIIIGGMVLMLIMGAAYAGQKGFINKENLSIKAGPTQPGEELSMVWMEFFVYPKKVVKSPMISLGTRLTSKADQVKVSFEFNGARTKQIKLSSRDGLSWNAAFELPADIVPGFQVARFNVIKNNKSVRRTLDFYVDDSFKGAGANNVSRGTVADLQSWPLTVLSDAMVYDGDETKELKKGQIVTGVAKVPFYKVIYDNGQEGWVIASKLLEPTGDYVHRGHSFFVKKEFTAAADNYQRAVKIDPGLAEAYYWLARARFELGENDQAQAGIMKVLELDERNIKARVFADQLAQRFVESADAKMKKGRFNEALIACQKALELNSQLVNVHIKLGKCFVALGLQDEAIQAWQEALSIDHENKELRALLIDDINLASKPAKTRKKKLPAFITGAKPASKKPFIAKKAVAHPALSDDAIIIVKGFITDKGTRIEAAVKSVVSMTRSLGTPVSEKGWALSRKDGKYLVSFIVDQRGVAEAFNWLVDVDTRRVTAQNENAKLLMRRW